MIPLKCLCTIIVLTALLHAQTFVAPIGEKYLQTANDVTVVTTDGKSVNGSVKMISMAGSQIQKIILKDASGQKHKFSSDEIKLIKYKMSKMAKAEQMVNTASASIENAVNTNYAALASQGYAVWEQVKEADGDDTYLLQVLNPFSCKVIKVYNVPKFVTVSGGFGLGKPKFDMPDELLVVKDGKTMEIKDKKYDKKIFPAVFGDCPAMMQKVAEKDRDWDDFPEHVKMYDDCRK